MTTYMQSKNIIVRKGVQVNKTIFCYLYNAQKSVFLQTCLYIHGEKNGSCVLESNFSM